jgi:hypothetical protein
MKVKDFHNNEHTLYFRSAPRSDKSILHDTALCLIKEIFPTSIICEEIKLPGTKLFADIVLPHLYLMIEVQGAQHFKYAKHFHKNKVNFNHSLYRDADKIEWCNINKFDLIYLNHNETIDVWRNKLINRIKENKTQ